MKFTHNVDSEMVNIIGEGKFIYFITAFFNKENIFVKLIKYMFIILFNCYNKINEISFTYNLDHILMYIMCKFHASTIFHWVFFSRESAFQNADFCPRFPLKTAQVLHMGYMIYFYYQFGF